jgi:hypothetical protein
VSERIDTEDRTPGDAPQAEGCPEQFSWNLMQQAWCYNADRRPRIEAERLSDHKPPEVPARHSQQFPGFLGRQPAGEGWVVDGSFSGRVFDLTLARADRHTKARLVRLLPAGPPVERVKMHYRQIEIRSGQGLSCRCPGRQQR